VRWAGNIACSTLEESIMKPSSTASRWLWPIVIALLVAALVIWFFIRVADVSPPAPQPERTPSSEWTTAPKGSAVKVDLPDTPMTIVPDEDTSPTPSESSEE
jgi:hypothetical protein